MEKIRLLVIEDNRLLREGITAMLNQHSEFKLVAAFGTSENILQKIPALKLDIMLLDPGLRSQNSLEVIRSIKKKSKEVGIIVMNLVPTQADILDYVKAGVSGFILKNASIEDLFSAVRSVARGEKVLPTHLTESLFTQIVKCAVNGPGSVKVMESVDMTQREQQVIELITSAMSNKEIAQKLHLSTHTVKSHIHNILEKLALHSRLQIARYVHDNGTVSTTASAPTLINA